MRRPLVVTCALVLLASGCGGGEQPDAPNAGLAAKPQAPSVRTPAGGLAETGGAGQAATPASPALSEVPASPAPRTFQVRPVADLERKTLARIRRLEADQRKRRLLTAQERDAESLAAVRGLTDAVLLEAGLRGIDFSVTGDGRIVQIKLAPRIACNLSADEPQQIEQRIDGASQIVDKVSVTMRGSKVDPAAYIRRHCKQTAPIPAAGKVVWHGSNTGLLDTRQFRVHSKHWTIEYENASAILQVYVYSRGKLRALPVNVRSRGAGKQVVDGAGTFTLRIASTGRWTVSVRDGA